MGLFQHCCRSAYCILSYPQQVPAFISRGATHHTDAQDLYQRRRELLLMNFASKSAIHENPLGSFTCRKAGTWDIFYFPSEGRHIEDFPDARKIQRLRPGLNPWTRVPVVSMLTTRPQRPSCCSSSHHLFSFIYFFPLWRNSPPVGQGLLIHEVSRSHTTTYHSRQDSSERVISSSQRPLPDNTQHSQQTDIYAPGGIRTHNLSRRAAADLHLRPRGHWDRLFSFIRACSGHWVD